MKEIAILTAIIGAVVLVAVAGCRMIAREVRKEMHPTPPTKKEWKEQNIFL